MALVLLRFSGVLFGGSAQENPFLMALVIVCVFIGWRFLFGPWEPHVKALVLGTFIFWFGVYFIMNAPSPERIALLIAIIIAFVPAFLWVSLFLEYHLQRKSIALLMFFAGMLSTAPILFYDAIVRHGIEFQFFLFRIVPENFNTSSGAFIESTVYGRGTLKSALLTAFVSFLIVGLVEELSKLWVVHKSGRSFFSSIDDVIQFSVIVAIGFAVAENILNPLYFPSFVKEYLITPIDPNWLGFFGNVLGRSILTTMVHILASGIMGYFLGLAIFGRSLSRSVRHPSGKNMITTIFHAILHLPEKIVFRRQVLLIGIVIASTLHGVFNFLVTLSEMLPNHPQTLGALFRSAEGSFLHHISILLIPSLFYVVGGMWLLTFLLDLNINTQHRGNLVHKEVFVLHQKTT